MLDSGHIVLAGQTLEYAHFAGNPRLPTLVLLHEGLGCVAMWKDFPAALAAHTGCPLWVYSRAGYGGSSAVALPRPLDFHTREALDVLPALLDSAGIDDCVLVGHSDGASIALIYAGAGGDPRVRGVVAMAPHVLTEAKCVTNIELARNAFVTTPLRARLARYHGDNVDCAFHGWADTWVDPRFSDWNIEHCLGAIRVPVLVIRGDADPYNTPVHVERIVAGVSGPVETLLLENCGHAPHAEHPQAVIAALDAFVGRVVAA